MEAARRRKIFLAESPGTPKRWRRSKKKKRDETAPAPAVPADQHTGGVSQNKGGHGAKEQEMRKAVRSIQEKRNVLIRIPRYSKEMYQG